MALSNGKKNKRIYFPEYLAKINLLFLKDKVSSLSFIFSIIDDDNDRVLTAPDLISLEESIIVDCPFHRELRNVMNFYIDKIDNKPNSNVKVKLDFKIFAEISPKSVLINEFRCKLLGTPSSSYAFQGPKAKDDKRFARGRKYSNFGRGLVKGIK